MSGNVPPGSRSGRARVAPKISDKQARAAAKLYEEFTGHDPEEIGVVNVSIPPVAAVIGECDGVLYTTCRDGKIERYVHEFAHSDKPLLCVSPDGRQLILVGGRYVFTDRGIVDFSDRKNLPEGLRRKLRVR